MASATATFNADFTKWDRALANAKAGLKSFEVSGKNAQSQLERLAKGFAGEQIIKQATAAAAAIEKIGGTSKLTEAELRRVAAITAEASEKMMKLGKEVPKSFDDIAQAAKKLDAPFGGLSTRMVAFGAAIGTFLGSAAYDAIKRLGSALVEVATRGISLAPVAGAFERLAQSVGETGDAMLKVSRGATRGLIADLDLMQAANKALLLGLPVTSQELGTLGQTAVVLGKAMGQGAAKSFDDLVTALGRSSPLILDNLGLTVKVGEANEIYARSIGKAVSELTDAEKKTAFYNAAMAAAKERVEELGGVQLTLADRITQVKNQFTNFTDALGIAIATSPVINAAFAKMADAIASAFGDDQAALVQRLMGTVNHLAIRLIDVGQASVTAASVMSRAWNGIVLVFSGTASIVDALGMGFVRLAGNIAKAYSFIPGIGDRMAKVADEIQLFEKALRTSQNAFHDQASAALEGVKGNSAFQEVLSKASKGLTEMGSKMAAASRQTVTLGAVAPKATAALNGFGKSAEDSAKASAKAEKEAEKAAKAFEKLVDRVRSVESADITLKTLSLADALSQVGKVITVEAEPAMKKWRAVLNQTEGDVARVEQHARILQFGFQGMADGLETIGTRVNPAMEPLIKNLKEAEKSSRGLGDSLKSLLSGDFGAVFKDVGKFFKGGIKDIGVGFLEGIGSGLLGMVSGLLTKGLSALGKGVGKLLGIDKEAEQVNDLRDAFEDTFGTLHDMNAAFQKVGLTVDRVLSARKVKDFQAAVEEFNQALAFQQDSWRQVQEAADRYGLTIEELGPAWQRQKLDEQAQQLFKDYQLLIGAGADNVAVLAKMADAVNKYVQQAVSMGQKVDIAMKPMIENMIKMGLLTDAAGNKIESLEGSGITFTETISEGFDRVIAAIDKMTDSIKLFLGITEEAATAVSNFPTFDGKGFDPRNFAPPTGGDIGPGNVGHAGGFVTHAGIQRFHQGIATVLPFVRRMHSGGLAGDEVPAILQTGEAVLNRRAASQLGRAAISALNNGNAGGELVTHITLEVDGRVLAEIVDRQMMNQLRVKSRLAVA